MCAPRMSPSDHRLGCHNAGALMEGVLREILANWGFLVRFKEGTQLRGTVRDARNVSIFLHLKISSDCLVGGWDMSGSSPVRWADVYGS